MPSSDTKTITKAIAMGMIAGMRSMAAPALVSNHFSHHQSKNIAGTPFRILGAPKTATALKALALGEMVADKLPIVPDRIAPASLVARTVSGALCGASVCAAERERMSLGGLAGGLAAIGSAYAFYYLRRRAGEESGLPDALLGLTEDAIVVCCGLNILGDGKPA
ncbi:MAG TPA: DUF4126 family protein [Blastocatellia bacterium]|jgi:uncharacterized membrane protein